jgi:hypothetical protein
MRLINRKLMVERGVVLNTRCPAPQNMQDLEKIKLLFIASLFFILSLFQHVH